MEITTWRYCFTCNIGQLFKLIGATPTATRWRCGNCEAVRVLAWSDLTESKIREIGKVMEDA